MSSNNNTKTLQVNTTLFALGIGSFAIGSDAFIAIGLVNEIAKDLHISAAVSGQIVTVFALCYAVFAPILAASFANKCRKKVLLATMLTFALGNVVCAISNDGVGIFLGRAIAALGAAAFTPQATAVAASLVTNERRGMALAIVFGGMTVAGAVGAPLGTFIGETAGWRVAFFVVAILGVCSLVLLAFLLHPVKEAAPAALKGILDPARNSNVLVTLTITFLIVLSEYIVYSFISVLFDGVKLGEMRILSLVFFAYGTGAVIGNIVSGFLTDRLGPYVILIGTVIAQTVIIAVVVLCRKQAFIALPGMFAWGVLSYMYLIPVQHRLLELTKKYGAFTISLNSSVIYIGIAAGGALGGLIIAQGSMELLVMVSLIAGFASVGMTYFFFPKSLP